MTTANCTKCRDNFPLPVAMDYFDAIVIADYTQRRTACTAVPDAEKPCLRPAPVPAAPTAAPTLADFAAWLTTGQQRALDAMSATTGETFGKHCDDFAALATAVNVLREFQQTAAATFSANKKA